MRTRVKEAEEMKREEKKLEGGVEGKISSGQLMVNGALRIMFYSGLRFLLSPFNTPISSNTGAANGFDICIPT